MQMCDSNGEAMPGHEHTCGASVGVLTTLAIAVAGATARNVILPLSVALQIRMPRQVSCAWGFVGIAGMKQPEALSHV